MASDENEPGALLKQPHIEDTKTKTKTAKPAKMSIYFAIAIVTIVGRFYMLKQGGDKQFQREIRVPNYPTSWEAREDRARSDKQEHPRNTLVRMAYAAVLARENKLSDAERELKLASVDSNAVEAVLPGDRKISLYVELAQVLLREGKAEEAKSILTKACNHVVDVAAFDAHEPCGR